ncbi:MAG TPA: hypothetical protein VEL31_14100 [Ktedonobacteraceae bacterium]|nr:hypothetical protein [Ktedonobacteraceae bacterium]
MVKGQKTPPKGYYTGKEAAERLDMPLATFYRRIRTQKIKVEKYIPTGYSEGFYNKKQIDELAQEMELEALLHSTEPLTFARVSSEDDIRGIVDLCIAIYGQNGTPSYDARLEIWQKNPEVYYIVKQGDIVVGYVSLIWFDKEALDVLMGPTPKQSRITPAGTGIYSVTGPEHVQPFTEGQPIDSLFISLGVRPGMPNIEQKNCAIKLLRGTQDVLANFAERGMPIRMFYATSERGDGKRLARKLGMKEIEYPNDRVLRYELETATSDSSLLKSYKQTLLERESQ